LIYQFKLVIFHGYVKLPEGNIGIEQKPGDGDFSSASRPRASSAQSADKAPGDGNTFP
jgi:hypothetical protein